MPTRSNPADHSTIQNIRCRLEIEAPEQVNGRASVGADQHRDLPAIAEGLSIITCCGVLDGLGVDNKAAQNEQLHGSSIEPRARPLYRLYQTLQ